mmetsp:Transcript_155329/g.477129  ORF Transcript_155329/g.477129 Transcript_155329/m.477129 type:complete len:312 (+) Transcript_155329:55-990(+)
MKQMKHMKNGDSIVSEKAHNKAVLGYVVASLLGMLGALVGGYAGYVIKTGTFSMEYTRGAGIVPIIAALVGFIIFFVIGLFLLGPGEHVYARFLSRAAMPESMERFQVTGFSSFDLYVTVHRIKNLFHADPCTGFFGNLASPYVEVVVGRYVDDDRQLSVQRNPPKRTCIASSTSFEECFHFVVSPTDDTIRFIVYDQDAIANHLVGKCDVNITDDVLAAGFPQKKSFKLARGAALDADKSTDRNPDHHAGSVIVSFAPGTNFPISSVPGLGKKYEFAVQRMQSMTGQLRSEAERSAGQYGSLVSKMSYGV